MSEVFPSQKPAFDLAFTGAGNESDPGQAFGAAVAQQILADRAGDPHAGAGNHKASLKRGKHRPDPGARQLDTEKLEGAKYAVLR